MKTTKHTKLGIEFINVTNDAGLSITLANLGAAIFSIKFLGQDMTYQPKNVKDFLRENVYHGKTIGRVAGRIRDGKFVIDGETYQVSVNEGKNTLHGGHGGFSEKYFSSEIFESSKQVEIIYSYVSKDGECGFPGEAKVKVHYYISEKLPDLKVQFECKVDKKCLISLTNHGYFCLGDSNINDFKLRLISSQFVEMDNSDLTLNNSRNVPFYLDFRNKRSVIETIEHPDINNGKLCGYDHVMLLDDVDIKKPQIELSSKHFEVDIYTDFDAVVMYSDNYEAGFEANNSSESIRRGMAIEPQLNPLNDRTLEPGKVFNHFILYKFSRL